MKRLACVSLLAVLAACGSAPVGPGFYRVERGDTLLKIARSNRQSVQSIVRWNNLSNPDSIEVGQVLRIAPPGGSAPVTAATASSGARSGSRGSAAATPAR
jgi:lipoprotein YgeR